MSHPRAKLTPAGRLLLVERVLVHGWSPAQTAEAVGVSRATLYKWITRYRIEGEAGLQDRSSRPHRLARSLPSARVQEILAERRRLRLDPHQLGPRLGLSRSTTYGILRRHGLSRLSDLDRTTREIIRYQKERPGELLHLDTKKLARIPEGGGHRYRGRTPAVMAEQRRQKTGYEFVHVAVDDASRAAYVEVLPNEKGTTTAGFLERACSHFAQRGVTVQALLTDRAFCYTQSSDFKRVLENWSIRHRTTRPYRPQTNGKAERFIRTLLHEWAYAELYVSNQDREALLPTWLTYYNEERPHTALNGASPWTFLVNKV